MEESFGENEFLLAANLVHECAGLKSVQICEIKSENYKNRFLTQILSAIGTAPIFLLFWLLL